VKSCPKTDEIPAEEDSCELKSYIDVMTKPSKRKSKRGPLCIDLNHIMPPIVTFRHITNDPNYVSSSLEMRWFDKSKAFWQLIVG
jgi:hypothetical protein